MSTDEYPDENFSPDDPMFTAEKKQGFASMSAERLREVSIRGGSRKVPKGVAILSPERRKEAARKAADTRWGRVKAERRVQKEQ